MKSLSHDHHSCFDSRELGCIADACTQAFSGTTLVALRRFVGALVPDQDDAADLAQDSLEVTWDALMQGRLRNPERARAFLFGVARRIVIQHRRRREYELWEPEAVERLADERGAELDEQIRAERRSRVRRAVSSMKRDRDRVLLSRYYFQEQSAEAICASTGLTRRQFRVALHRARRRLRSQLEEADAHKSLPPRRPPS